MAIDLKTLFLLTIDVEAMLGLLLLLVWVQGRATPAIAWWACAHLLRSASIALFGMYGSVSDLVSIGVADGILFSSYAVTWTGARIFDGRKPLPGSLLAGATVWLFACQFPAFAEAADLRAILSAGIIASFMWLTAYELWRGRADGLVSRWPAVFIFFAMGATFLLRMPLSLVLPWFTSDSVMASAWLTLISTESLLATISSAFILLAMAKERAGLHQKIAAGLQAEKQIAYNLRHDGLTGLANRPALLDRLNEELARACHNRYGIAVHQLDLDHFKNVNETLGHSIGDQLLCIVATRLGQCIRNDDMVARLGGDEFGVVQILTNDKEEAGALARRLIEAIHEPYKIDGHELIISASIGISVTSGNGEDAGRLLKDADIALHCAKVDGRHSHRYFEPQMDARLQSRRTLELDLRSALLRQEFKVTYQPIINLDTNEVTGFEALLRWHHPQRGLVGPDEFISLAEDTKVILPVGDWVLWQACADAAKWPEHLTLAVNLSPIQFKKFDLAQCVARALASAGLSANRLELEITESVLLQDSESTLDTLRQLRNMGVRIVMDDFGVGHSSLNYLCKFPFDKIKIDRSFVKMLPQNAECLAIVRAAVGIATSLGISTTAEGVETPEQLEQVRVDGCTNVQGFLFSPSMKASECEAFMARNALAAATANSGACRPRPIFARSPRLSVSSDHAQFEAELQRLNPLIERTRLSDQSAQQNRRLLKEIIDHLPISVTVQDDSGRFILANAMAAANLATPAEILIGASPTDFLPEQEAASRREWEQNVLRRGRTITVEENVSSPHGERTWQTSHKPVRILDRPLLISSSIDITEHKQIERALVERAHIDELTGLPDRILIQEHVEAAIYADDGSRHFALAFIDLDNFKHINDYYGHAVGDALLVSIGQRIASRLRSGDILARISGDEFLLLFDPFESEAQIRSAIDGILNGLKQPFHIEAFEVFSSCSIGISIYPEHGRSYEALRRNADSAMYRAKHVAKGDAIFFDHDMGQAITAQMEVEQRLRLAIRDRRLCCAFQPKVDIQTRQVVGFETLVRWRDDDGEIHPPGEFIDLAIELGLINPITNFVLAEAVNSIDCLDAAFGPGTTISINVAAKQASDLEFMRSFVQALSDSKRAERIIIEVTEEAFIAKGKFQAEILPILREIGVRVSIDDFGTGYSSLSALADITADEIKIDRSFISGIHERPRNQGVLRAIESLGGALGMTIVAEGVESFEELAYLHAATRIRYVQGFYFSKPIYLEDLKGAKNVDFMILSMANPQILVEPRPKHPICGEKRNQTFALAPPDGLLMPDELKFQAGAAA